MAADGTGDRPLFDRLPSGCDAPGHVSLSPVDENILVLQCNPKSGPSRLMVMTIDGDLVRNLPTGHVSVDDPSISPDGRTVAYLGLRRDDRTDRGFDLHDRHRGRRRASRADRAARRFRRRSGLVAGRRVHRRSVGAAPTATGTSTGWARTAATYDRSSRVRAETTSRPGHPTADQLMIISNRDAKDQSATSFDLYLLNDDGTGLKPLGFAGQRDLDPHLVAPVAG